MVRTPAEWEPHECTYMAWPTGEIWGRETAAVREDVAAVARAIAEFEPVIMLAEHEEAAVARRSCGSGVEVVTMPVDDLWIRDTGPTFVSTPSGQKGVDFNFNGWGCRQRHDRDASVARRILRRAGVHRSGADLVAEGGALEVDGAGTLMATESSLVNDNRNPGRSRADIESALKAILGITKMIWFGGVRNRDITDHHIDAVARFTPSGVVIVNRPAPGSPRTWRRDYEAVRRALATATDARGRRLETVDLPEPAEPGGRGSDFLGNYVNYYVVNGAVIAPRFDDTVADDRAVATLRELHPGRQLVQAAIDTLAEGGGGIHCATRQRPV